MDAPRCRLCGERHWTRVCVTKPVAAPVTRTVAVTEREATEREIDSLRAEVAQLKLALAKALTNQKVPPKTSAERVRKFRARRRAAQGQQA